MKMTEITCAKCGKVTEKPAKEIKRRKKLGKTKFYCSLSCKETTAAMLEWSKSDDNKNRLLLYNHARGISDEEYVIREHMRRIKIRIRDSDRDIFTHTDIDKDYLKDQWNRQEGKCAYTGVDLKSSKGGNGNKNYQASLDRIDNTIGYLKGNIQFVSVTANWLKNNKDTQHVAEFFDIVRKSNILTLSE